MTDTSDTSPEDIRIRISADDWALLGDEAKRRGVDINTILTEEVERQRKNDRPSEVRFKTLYEFSCGMESIPSKKFIGDKAKSCIFCGKCEPDVTFKKEAHIVPAAFGNRSLFSNEECDGCNHDAGKLFENHLVDSLTPLRALMAVRTRKGHAKHKPRGQAYVKSSGKHTAIVTSDDDPSIKVKTENSQIHVTIDGPQYKPMRVGKALARMALFVLSPDQRSRVKWLFSWLKNDVSWCPIYIEGFFPGPRHLDYKLRVFETRNPARPFVVEFGMGNFKYLLMLPVEPVDEASPDKRVEVIHRDNSKEGCKVHVHSDEMLRDSSVTITLEGTVSEDASLTTGRAS